MAECFVLLRGTSDGPAHLAWIEAPGYADAQHAHRVASAELAALQASPPC